MIIMCYLSTQIVKTFFTDCVNEPYCSDIQGFKAISELHSQLDDDRDGQVDSAESDGVS